MLRWLNRPIGRSDPNRLRKGEPFRSATAMLRPHQHLIELAFNFGRLHACCKNATPIAEITAAKHKRFVLLSVVGHI